MTRHSHNTAEKLSRDNDDEGVETPLNRSEGKRTTSRAQIVKRCLSIMEPKQVAEVLGVAIRTVQKWASGETIIPKDREDKILFSTKGFFLTDLSKLEAEIDRCLLETYGPSDRGEF